MTPLAPGMFSTANCWPSSSESLAQVQRTMLSKPEPGANGMSIRMGLVGQAACACATREVAPMARAVPARPR